MFRYFCFCLCNQSAEPWPDRQWLSKAETWSKDYAPRLHPNRGETCRMLDDDGGNEGVRDKEVQFFEEIGCIEPMHIIVNGNFPRKVNLSSHVFVQ